MIKEEMELHEVRAKRMVCRRFWYTLPERISRTVEHFFYRLGVHIAQKPYRWMLGCLVVVLVCLLGLLRFRQEKNPLRLWVPPDSDFVRSTEWLMSHYSEALRIETFILTGDNLLEQQTLIKLNEITKQMMTTRTPENISWTDVCMRVPAISGSLYRQKRQSSLLEDNFFDDDHTSNVNQTFEPSIHVDSNTYCSIIESLPMSCLVFSILDLWDFDSDKIEKDSTEEIITKVNTVKVSPRLGHTMNFSELLGDVTLDERGRIIAAGAIRTDMMVHVSFLNVDMDKIGNNAGTADWATEDVLKWESAYLENVINLSNQLQSERNMNDSLKLYYEAGRSFGDISATSIFQDMDKLVIGSVLMFLYVLTILSNQNWVEWRFCLTGTGLLCVGAAFIFAVGICSLIGIPYGPVHTSLPFMLLGLGIDDIFVLNASWKQIHTDESNLNKPLTERIGLALGHAGSAISITSLTDVVAFIIGASTILPSLQSFCIYAAVGVFVTFLLQITFFTACFTLDARRIERKRNGMLPCIVHENFTPKSLDISNAISWKFINFLYSKIVLTTPGKIIIVLITLVTMSISITGLLRLQQWFDPTWLLPKESYLNEYIALRYQAFPDQGFNAFVLMGDDIDYSSEFPKIIYMTERLQNASFIQTIEPWPIDFAKFVSTYYTTDLRTTKIADDEFHHYLSKFLFSRGGGKYQRNFFFNEKLRCGRDAPRIISATIDFNFRQFKGPDEWVPAMDNSKLLTNEAQIHGYVTVWSKMFGPWTADKLIGQEVSRNIILALICVMGTTTFLIAEVQTCCWILLCVLLTLLNVCGYMYFWGLTIDVVSCIGLELAVGLSVDYAAHVAHAFLNAESREDDDNARRTRTLTAVRHIGAAVAYGAGSTFLAVSLLAFSTSYVFVAFFRIFSLVIMFGLWHGLILLPVILSTIGPQSLRVIQQPQPMSEKAIAAADDED
ncbi:NPC intracellular cholesterol transporter 1-like isoform X1 [Temnothorax curvispinosus]|uniref:NPC intracellular cholesterol transporter 1-like isoform X1 n=2 Tax=Temnothorax curvispinosus TaxID=300111 RepID=A0A6J1Q0X2_9HYME|nr:NPC intracellular cholesterol transporter 1-like isoform X1 [Temnothorax curvispinosus]XP_024875785.1 NPC intracellular cholesterol transporter 1-like isoform X1 [Temnothorax curvispinosus]